MRGYLLLIDHGAPDNVGITLQLPAEPEMDDVRQALRWIYASDQSVEWVVLQVGDERVGVTGRRCLGWSDDTGSANNRSASGDGGGAGREELPGDPQYEPVLFACPVAACLNTTYRVRGDIRQPRCNDHGPMVIGTP